MTKRLLLVLLAVVGCKERQPALPPATLMMDAGTTRPTEPVEAIEPFEARITLGPLWNEVVDAGLGLAFTSERSGTPQLHRLEGTSERALTVGPAAHHLQTVALRSSEAVVSTVEGAGEALEAISLRDGRLRSLMKPLEKAHAAQLSATEDLLIFESSLTHASSLSLLGLDGRTEPWPLPELGQTGSFQPSFTRDGRVLFTSSASGDPEVYLSTLDGGATHLTAFHLEDFGAVASPEGARFAFVSNREGNDRVFVQGLDGRNVGRLLPEKRAPDELENDPVWMPDGKSVLVTIRSKQQSRIARVEVATHRVLWTTKAAEIDQLPRPSPDGRFIAFVSDRQGNADVYLMRGNGTGAEPLTQHTSAEYGPRWFVRSAPSRH